MKTTLRKTLRPSRYPARLRWTAVLLGASLLALLVAGCDSDDCVNCVDEPPVVPTGVHSISGDGYVTVQWYDISYYPYDEEYNPNVVTYVIYSRYYEEGDEYDLDREFYPIGEVAWDENYDDSTGLHWFDDILTSEILAEGHRFEYAVSAVNAAGTESALSYEVVIDSPVEMDLDGVRIYAADGPEDEYSILSGFDFSDLLSQPVDPWATSPTHDIRVFLQGGIPYATTAPGVRIQDYGMFVDDTDPENPYLVFEGVSWAPADYYSESGVVELIAGHIYVLKIEDGGTNYAKFGVTQVDAESVIIVWAYQTVEDLPELNVPDERKPEETRNPLISL